MKIDAKNQKNFAIYSLLSAAAAYGVIYVIFAFFGIDINTHVMTFICMIPPFAGMVFAVYVYRKVSGNWKALPFLGLIANLLVFAYAFLLFSFSYWQF